MLYGDLTELKTMLDIPSADPTEDKKLLALIEQASSAIEDYLGRPGLAFKARTSGTFPDPTSGLPANAFPIGGRIASGGIFWANSGLYLSGASSPAASVDAAPIFCSGGVQYASFQRPHRYARIWCTSGNASLAAVPFHAGFISQKKVTGASGTAAGFSYSPGSGTVNV